jgi:AcrR family transcriptional regulator
MQRDQKAERSRRQVLDAALELFSHQGYRATTIREIAEAAKVSVGSVYHHFPEKDAIFQTLLEEYWQVTSSNRYPFRRALLSGDFPDNLERLGLAARESVRLYRQYFALIYVDVIEFEGTHIRKFYGELPQRFLSFLQQDGFMESIQARLRPGVSPVSALLITSRIFFNYFSLEILFGVEEPFGKNSMDVVKEIADILRNGMVIDNR